MTDIFLSEDAAKLLRGKKILFLGDSVTRGLYKDLIWLLNSKTLIPRQVLGQKGEVKFPELKLIPSTERKRFESNQDQLHICRCPEGFRGLNSGRRYTETRKYINKENKILIGFKFISTVFSDEMKKWIKKFKKSRMIDIIIMNSCLWDINRWGPTGKELYEGRLEELISFLKTEVPTVQFYWMTTLPISSQTTSRGMGVQGLEFQNYSTRFSVVEANHLSAKLMKKAGFNVIDINFALQAQTKRRNRDGIHWSAASNRLVTNICLTHLTLTLPSSGPGALPGRMRTSTALANLIRTAGKKEIQSRSLRSQGHQRCSNRETDFLRQVNREVDWLIRVENKREANSRNEKTIARLPCRRSPERSRHERGGRAGTSYCRDKDHRQPSARLLSRDYGGRDLQPIMRSHYDQRQHDRTHPRTSYGRRGDDEYDRHYKQPRYDRHDRQHKYDRHDSHDRHHRYHPY